MSPSTLALWLRALRPKQWVKNILVAAAPGAAGSLNNVSTISRTLAAMAAFVVASGCSYLVNDAADVEIDRAHPTKRLRPIAAGQISVGHARSVAAVLAVLALAGAFALDIAFGLVIVAYLVVNLAYSAGLKHWPWVELGAVASGFVLRAVGGGAATNTPLSAWFVIVVCGVAMFVVTGKRSAELRRTAGTGGRQVLAHYRIGSLSVLSTASATIAVLAYALWILNQDLVIDWLATLSLVPFTAALARYSTAIDSGRGEDPEDIALGDRPFQALAVLWIVVYGLARYG